VAESETPHFNVALDGDVIVAHGDIDMASGPLLDAAIQELEGRGPVIVDMSDVEFVDSSGLRSLLAASQRARLSDRMVTLRGVGPEVARLLEITGTTELFEIEQR
jgi:anti-sigma B factor antagonist